MTTTTREAALATLGLDSSVTDLRCIRSKFKLLALKLHPDRKKSGEDTPVTFNDAKRAYEFLRRGRRAEGSRKLFRVTPSGSVCPVAEDAYSAEQSMGLGDEEESVSASVTMTACPLCLKAFKVGRGLRSHLSRVHALAANSEPMSLEAAMNFAVATFAVTATSSFSATQWSASVAMQAEGIPRLADKVESAIDVSAERVRARTCQKASAAAAVASVRAWRSGSGKRSVANLSHPGLTAARDGDVDTLRKLLQDDHFDVRMDVGPHGETAMHWCSGSGHIDVLELLMNAGDVDQLTVRDKRSGRSAVHWAARNGHQHFLEALMRQWPDRIDLDSATFDGTTPLQLASYAGHTSTVAWLVQQGCNAHHKNNFDCNALFFACIGSQLATCQFLYEKCNVDAFAVQNQGHTALHKAAYAGAGDICEWLQNEVRLDPDCNIEDAKGHKADDLARIRGFDKLAQQLKSRCRSSLA